MNSRADKFRQAAVTYVGVGIVVIALTLIAGTSPQRGAPPLVGLLIGVIFVAIFGVVIYSYSWVGRGWLSSSKLWHRFKNLAPIPCLFIFWWLWVAVARSLGLRMRAPLASFLLGTFFGIPWPILVFVVIYLYYLLFDGLVVRKWQTHWEPWRIIIVVLFFPLPYLLYYVGWRRIVIGLTSIFVVTNALRTVQYVINFLGYRLELSFKTLNVAVHPSDFSFPLIFLICALLMAGITYMLARAAWDL